MGGEETPLLVYLGIPPKEGICIHFRMARSSVDAISPSYKYFSLYIQHPIGLLHIFF